MSDAPRELIIMRHAKAEPIAADDHDRRLTDRGVADASAAGRWAREHGFVPDHVVVSSAARTCGTWAAFSAASQCSVDAEVDPGLYPAGPDAAMEILRTVPPEARRVLVIGHNPTMAYLVHLLDDGGAEAPLFAELSAGYPTAALTVLDVQCPWSELDLAGARITAFHVPRGD